MSAESFSLAGNWRLNKQRIRFTGTVDPATSKYHFFDSPTPINGLPVGGGYVEPEDGKLPDRKAFEPVS